MACWSDRFRARFFLLIGSVLPLVGTYLTLTRSALIAIAAGILTILALVDARRRLHLVALLAVGGGLAGLLVLSGVVDQRLLSGTEDDTSAAGHLALSQVALAVALDHPLLGIGHENFEVVSRAYLSDAFVGSSGPPGKASSRAIGVYRPHNDYLEVWTSWGIVGLLTYLAIFVGALHNCIVARRSSDTLVRGLAIGCAAGIVSYAVGSAFHNYMDSSVMLWCYAGLSAALVARADPATVRLAALRHRPARWLVARPLRADLAPA